MTIDRWRPWHLFLLALVLARSMMVGMAQDEVLTVTVQPVQDAVIYGLDTLDEMDRGNGAGEFLVVGVIGQGVYQRSLIRFQIEDIVPPGSKVTRATLKLKLGAQSIVQPFLQVFRAEEAWSEGPSKPTVVEVGGPAEEGDVTWFYREYVDDESDRVSWKEPGGTFDANKPLIQAVGQPGSDGFLSYTSDAFITDVQSMVDNPLAHQGWFLLSSENPFERLGNFYHSRDSPVEADRPVLEISYTEASDFDKLMNSFNQFETVAGAGEQRERENHWETRFEGGPALEAELSLPLTSVQDTAGNVYIADTWAHAVRRVDNEGLITTIAGTNAPGFNGDGKGPQTQLNLPSGLYLIDDSRLYIVDTDNDRIRRLDLRSMDLDTVIHDGAGIDTGRGLWVRRDEAEIIYASGTVLKKWTRTDPPGDPVVFASGFSHLGFIDCDPNTGDILAADFDRDVVWRVAAGGGEKSVIAGGGNGNSSGFPATTMRLPEVHGIAAVPFGYFVTTVDGGDVWFFDSENISHLVLAGSSNSNVKRGEGELLAAIVENGENVVSEPLAITVAFNGDLVITTNPSGLIRIVRKGASPVLAGIRVDANDLIRIDFLGERSKTYRLEGSPDLFDWEELSVRTLNRPEGFFVDPESNELDHRYYRIGLLP